MPDSRFHYNTGSKTVAEILSVTGAVMADPVKLDKILTDVMPLQAADANHLSFFENSKYLNEFKETKAGACFVKPEHAQHAHENVLTLTVDNPHKAYAKACQIFYPVNQPVEGAHQTATIAKSARVDTGTQIDANAVIGENVLVGQNCHIMAGAVINDNVVVSNNTIIGNHASLSHCIIGNNCVIYPGARIGQSGFGFAADAQGVVKVPQLGRVIIGHYVEIGANSTVDRGAGPDTIIGDYTMIDNLVQIGHNVQIGVGCIIAAMVGIAGSTIVDDFVQMGGQAGLAGHLKIGKAAKIAANSGVMKDIAPKEAVGGSPAQPIRQWMKQIAYLKKIVK